MSSQRSGPSTHERIDDVTAKVEAVKRDTREVDEDLAELRAGYRSAMRVVAGVAAAFITAAASIVVWIGQEVVTIRDTARDAQLTLVSHVGDEGHAQMLRRVREVERDIALLEAGARGHSETIAELREDLRALMRRFHVRDGARSGR